MSAYKLKISEMFLSCLKNNHPKCQHTNLKLGSSHCIISYKMCIWFVIPEEKWNIFPKLTNIVLKRLCEEDCNSKKDKLIISSKFEQIS